MNSNVMPLPVRCLIGSLALLLGLAACGEKSPAVPADEPAAPARVPTPASDTTQPASVAAPAEAARRTADAELAARVKSALVADRGINALEIDVVAAQGAVTLFGTAPTRASRDRAAGVASQIEGVKSVTNKLAVVAGS